jgi:CDGSH-type Zn-finger protein
MANTKVHARPNGPYLVQGPFDLVDPAGNTISFPAGRIVALCRCGNAKTKPYCDGTHNSCGFVGKDPAPPRD